jgi:hypothetical protein
VLVNFKIGYHFMLWSTWTTILLFVLPCVASMTGASHHTQSLVETRSCELFCQVQLPTAILPIYTSQVTRTTGMSPHARLSRMFFESLLTRFCLRGLKWPLCNF